MLLEILFKYSFFWKLDECVEIGIYLIYVFIDKYSDWVLFFVLFRVFVGLCFVVYVSV